jgi:hypothetical protein
VTIREQAQEIAERVATHTYRKVYNLCIEEEMDEEEAKQWASDQAALAYERALDEWTERLDR